MFISLIFGRRRIVFLKPRAIFFAEGYNGASSLFRFIFRSLLPLLPADRDIRIPSGPGLFEYVGMGRFTLHAKELGVDAGVGI